MAEEKKTAAKDEEEKEPKISKSEATAKLLRALTKAAVFGSENEAVEAAKLVEVVDPTPEDQGQEDASS